MQPEPEAEKLPLTPPKPAGKTSLGRRLVTAFLVLSSIVAAVGFFSFSQLNKLTAPLTVDIPRGLEEVERTSHLDSLAQKIRLYDQILTESVRDYVKTGDRQHRYRYQEFEPRLSSAIREAIEKGDEADKRIFGGVQNAKRSYGAVDAECLRLMDEGQGAAAMALLESLDYWQAKRAYKQSLEPYVERRGKERGESLEAAAAKVDAVVRRTHVLLQESIRMLLTFSLFAAMLAVFLGLMVSRTILRPIRRLQRGAEIIGKGELEHRIDVRSGDEIGQLAGSFNEMAEKLSESYLRLEDKVKEKTRELEQKYEEEKEQKKKLEMSKAAMLNLLEDLEQAKAEITEEKAKDEAILASLGDGLIAAGSDGRIIMMNAQAEALLGIKASEAVGRDFSEIVPGCDEAHTPMPRAQQPLAACLELSRKTVSTAFYRRRDGSFFPAAITASPIQRAGRTLGAIQIFRDVTREKEVDRMKTEFISVVSHELRTPLTVIREGVSLVMDGVLGATTDEQRNFLLMALKDIDRLGRIINNLLDISKIEAGKVELRRAEIDLAEAADHVLETFAARARTAGLELRKDFSAAPLRVYADRDKLVQVFTNLVSNALKFTEKGSIEISIRDEESQVVCGVRDTGRGISPENLKRVFGKFQQFGGKAVTGEKGTGLGLSIARGIVQLHQGQIWVESVQGEGTVFFFSIPKLTPLQAVKDQLARDLRSAVSDHASLLISVFSVEGAGESDHAAACFEEFIQPRIRERSSRVLRDGRTVYVILSGVMKEEGEELMDSAEKDFRSEIESGTFPGAQTIRRRSVSYPEDGSTEEELMTRLKAA